MTLASVLNDPAYLQLKAFVMHATGLAFYENRDEDLASRMRRRLSCLNIRDWHSYLDLLQDPSNGRPELDALVGELTIGETYFFRYPEHFETLEEFLLPEIIQRNQSCRQLRVWSAGCSTGAEAYSVSMLLKRKFALNIAGWRVRIVGTDINRTFLERAESGKFSNMALRSTPDEIKDSCFEREGSLWSIKPEYKRDVSFEYHNLVRHSFPSLVHNLVALDLILCRNVMIYFSSAVAQRVIKQFWDSLAPGGWLLVGHAEHNPDLFRAFRSHTGDNGFTLYQRPVAASELLRAPTAEHWKPPVVSSAATVVAARPKDMPLSAHVPKAAAAPVSIVDDIRKLADQGAWEEAARYCASQIEAASLDARVHFYQGLVLEQMGHAAEAEAAFRKCIYLDRRFVLAHFHLGVLLQQQAKGRHAEQSFRNVLRLIPELPQGISLPDGDGLTAADLQDLTQLHLEPVCH